VLARLRDGALSSYRKERDVMRAGRRIADGREIGKTTTAADLAVAWGASGLQVLAVDLDPQFSLTRRFGVRNSTHVTPTRARSGLVIRTPRP